MIARHLATLKDAERRWCDQAVPVEERERDQIGDRAEWHNVVDMHELLADAYDAGALNRSSAERYLELSRELVRARPSLERLRLRMPSEDLLRRLLNPRDTTVREIVR